MEVKKYVFGEPVETAAVVEEMPVVEGEPEGFTLVPLSEEELQKEGLAKKNHSGEIISKETAADELAAKEEAVKKENPIQNKALVYRMRKTTRVYGLGEANRGINKRGFRYVSFCSDEPSHTEEKESLYGAHNFLLLVEQEHAFGIFVDNPGKVIFDIGYEEINTLRIIPKYPDMVLYIITGGSVEEILKRFRKMIGKSYVAPKWAFGFGQCRWSYETAEKVNEVIENYEKNDMLLSSVYMDIDYMQDYKDFTVNPERFPDFKQYVEKIRQKGIRLVPIIDAGVKIEEGYDVYEEGVAGGYFVQEQDGRNFTAAVWPGYTHFPDFLNEKASTWFGEKYSTLLDMGIEGFWNDMNEPAIFYSKNKVEQLKKELTDMDIAKEEDRLLNGIRWEFAELQNNPEDYETMVHMVDGKPVCHDRVHNLYGYRMSRAAGEYFTKYRETKPDADEILLFSRASYIGMHRYAGIWMGDNCSWWSHILLNLKMLPSLNMCGFLYIGADVGGFGCHSTEDLVMRWMALGVFTPLFRNHSALNTREQECYQFTDTPAFKDILDARYRLLPYLYETYLEAVEQDEMMYRPLAFVYPEDEVAVNVEDQLFLGRELMIAPVYTQNATGRYVYLPENMTFVKFGRNGEVITQLLAKGVHFVKVALHEVPFFVREGKRIKLVKKSVIADKTLRKQIMDCTIKYQESDFEYIGE